VRVPRRPGDLRAPIDAALARGLARGEGFCALIVKQVRTRGASGRGAAVGAAARLSPSERSRACGAIVRVLARIRGRGGHPALPASVWPRVIAAIEEDAVRVPRRPGDLRAPIDAALARGLARGEGHARALIVNQVRTRGASGRGAAVGAATRLSPSGRSRLRRRRDIGDAGVLAISALGDVARWGLWRRRRRRRRRGRGAVPPGLALQAREEPVAPRLVVGAGAVPNVRVVGRGELEGGVEAIDLLHVRSILEVHVVGEGHVGEADLHAVLLDEVDLHHGLLLQLAVVVVLVDDRTRRVVLALSDARRPDGDPLVGGAVVDVDR